MPIDTYSPNTEKSPDVHPQDISANFRHSRHYFNATDSDVVVQSRNNLPTTIHSNNHFGINTDFVIKDTYVFNDYYAIQAVLANISVLEKTHGERFPDLKYIREVLSSIKMGFGQSSPNVRNTTINIERYVPIALIKEKDILYIPDSDIVLHYKHYKQHILHPYSSQGDHTNEHKKLAETKTVSGLFLEIVDNDNQITDRYVYTSLGIIKCSPVKNLNKQSGVYMSIANNTSYNDAHIEPTYINLDESLTKGFYKTEEEAQTNGNPEHKFKVELSRLQQEIQISDGKQKLSNSKLKELQTEFETEKLIWQKNVEIEKRKNIELENNLEREAFNRKKLESEHASELNRIKSEREDYYDRRQKSRKDYYEDRSAVREDNSQWIKMAGVALVAGLAAWKISTKD
jgi:hypothetical protein